MNNDESLFAQLGVTDPIPPLPDDVWDRALSIALDPATPAVDAALAPEMEDHQVVPDDGDIVLYDTDEDEDEVSVDDQVDPAGDLDLPDHEVEDHFTVDTTLDDAGITHYTDPLDLTLDDQPDLGGDLY